MLKNCTTKCAVVAVVTLSVFGDRPSQKFLIWFAFLEVPDLGDILHTHQSIQKKKKKRKLAVLFPKLVQGPALITQAVPTVSLLTLKPSSN